MPLTDLNAGLQMVPTPQGWTPAKHFVEYRFAPAFIPVSPANQAAADHRGKEVSQITRGVTEVLVVQAYRRNSLSAEQVRRLLGLGTRLQVDEFLKQHGVYDCTPADFERDR